MPGNLFLIFLLVAEEEPGEGEQPYDEEIHERKKSGRKTLKEYKITKGMFNFLYINCIRLVNRIYRVCQGDCC